MSYCFSILVLLGAVSLNTACSAEHDNAASGGTGGGAVPAAGGAGAMNAQADPNCVSGDAGPGTTIVCFRDLMAFPFAAFVVAYSTTGTAPTMSFPAPGKICLTGVNPPGEYAGFNLEFAARNREGTKILKAFDAARLGITKIGFTLDSPPTAGVRVHWQMLRQFECPNDPGDCSYPPSFTLATLLDQGPVSAPFSDFVSDGSSLQLDTSALVELLFQPGTGSYDFCIHDFKMLDAQDREVKP